MRILRRTLKENTYFIVDENLKVIVAVAYPKQALYDLLEAVVGDIYMGDYVPNSLPDKIKATARCSPEDSFDVEYGKRLAFEKLFRRQ